MAVTINAPSSNIPLGFSRLVDFLRGFPLNSDLYRSLGKGSWNLVSIDIGNTIKINSIFSDEIIFRFIKDFIKNERDTRIFFDFDCLYLNPTVSYKKMLNSILDYFVEKKIFVKNTIGKEGSRLQIKINEQFNTLEAKEIIKKILITTTILSVYNVPKYSFKIRNEYSIEIEFDGRIHNIKSNIDKNLIKDYFNNIFSIDNDTFPCSIFIYLNIKELDGEEFITAERHGELIKQYGSLENPKIEKTKF